MTPSGAEAERKQAARAGRRMLARALPPGFRRHLDRLAGTQESPEEIYAWTGALAAIASDLERAFHESGTEVRDHILQLHTLLSEGEDSGGKEAWGELRPFISWLNRRLEDSEGSPPVRIVLMQWIDVASERLTLRRYYRPDLPAHHARTLIVIPAHMMGLSLGTPAKEQEAEGRRDAGDETAVALALLRFVDLLSAERLAQEGKNRISAPDRGEFGGFFGVSENVQPVTNEELEASLRDLRSRTSELTETAGFAPEVQAFLEDIGQALDRRLEAGTWPAEFEWKSRARRGRRASWLQRLLGRG